MICECVMQRDLKIILDSGGITPQYTLLVRKTGDLFMFKELYVNHL